LRSGVMSAGGAMRAARLVSSTNPPQGAPPAEAPFATGVREIRTSNRWCTGARMTRAEAGIVRPLPEARFSARPAEAPGPDRLRRREVR
jgi:hypothetical protein